MRKQELEQTVRNIDRRLGQVEQILPTLATREELHAEIAAAVAPLATKAELAAAIAPLATKAELAAAIAPLATKEDLRASESETRRHFDVVAESLRDDIRLIAEGQMALHRKVDALGNDLKRDIAKLDARVTRLEARA